MDRATQAGHADFADLDVRDAVEHWFTLSCSLGVKWSQVQILSARHRETGSELLLCLVETAIMVQLLFVWDHVFGCEAFFGRTCPMVK